MRGSIEETLNAMLKLRPSSSAMRVGTSRPKHVKTRAAGYRRRLASQAGEGTLKIPKLQQQTLEAATIERYRRRESSVEVRWRHHRSQ